MIWTAKNYGFMKYDRVDEAMAHSKLASIIQSSFELTVPNKLANSTKYLVGNATFHTYFQSETSNKSWELLDFVDKLQQVDKVLPSQLVILTNIWRSTISQSTNRAVNKLLVCFEIYLLGFSIRCCFSLTVSKHKPWINKNIGFHDL